MSGLLTVTTAAKTHNLVSRAVIKRRLKIEGAREDDDVDEWIADASSAITRYLKRSLGGGLGLKQLAELFHSRPDEWGGYGEDLVRFATAFGYWGYQKLILSCRPVTAIAQILDEAGNVIDPSLYLIEANTGIVRLSNNRPLAFQYDPLWPHGKLTVDYGAGYDLPDNLPADARVLRQAAIRLVGHYRAVERRDPALVEVEVTGVGRRRYWVGSAGDNGALPPEVIDLICELRDTLAA